MIIISINLIFLINEDFSNFNIEPEIVSGLNIKSSYLTEQVINFKVYDGNQNDITNIEVNSLPNGINFTVENQPDSLNGSAQIANYIANQTKSKSLYSVAGGGDTIALLNKIKAIENFNFVSTAGGAFLEYLEGKELPGIKALN